MGKPYIKELYQLESTYEIALSMDIDNLGKAVYALSSLPLYTVGSGGSLSTSCFVALLHQRFANQFANAITPLEVVDIAAQRRKSAFWFMSANGRNKDINNSFYQVVLDEPKSMLITCARTGSPLANLAYKYKYTDVFEFDLPSRKDGFLATNSLVAFAVLSARAYLNLFNSEYKLPSNIWSLLNYKGSTDNLLSKLRKQFSTIWNREHIIVLFDPLTKPAAKDIESKFTEAALGPVLLADYRNFAHGRHHWLAKHSETSAVISLVTNRNKELAQKTINLLPSNIPIVEMFFSGHEIGASLAALTTILYIVALAGEAKGIDPGRPGVPSFGSKIYHLGGIKKTKRGLGTSKIAITRKKQILADNYSTTSQDYKLYQKYYRRFIRSLENQKFPAVVFDYDGTLCDRDNRFGKLTAKMAEELIRLLRAKITIGIATGRGKSVRFALQEALPKSLWNQVVIGYYNGAECGLLAEDGIPNSSSIPCAQLSRVSETLQNKINNHTYCKLTVRKYQLTIEAKPPIHLDQIWRMTNDIVQDMGVPGVKVLTSSHSVDVLAPCVSKMAVVKRVCDILQIESDTPILCIGDRGQWPGNDYELLKSPFSLSVDEVSNDFNTCWNLSPAGYRGVQATYSYLSALQIEEAGFKINVSHIKG